MLRRLWTYIAKQKGTMLLVLFFALTGSGLALTAPLFLGNAVDLLAGPGAVNFEKLIITLAELLAVYLGSALFQWLVPFLAVRVAGKTVQAIRTEAFTKMGKLPLRFFDTNKHGDVISTMTNDIDNIAEGISQLLAQLFTGLITVLGTLGFLFALSPYVALAVLCITPLSVLIARYITKHSSQMFKEQQKYVGRLGGYAEETISGMHIIKSFTAEEATVGKFRHIDGELYKVGQKAQFYSALVNPTTRFVNHLSYISVGVLGGLLAIWALPSAPGMTIGKIASLLTYATQFAKPINEITAVTTQVQNAMASSERIFRLIDEQTETPEPETMPALSQVAGRVEFRHVSFGYRPDKILIKDMNLTAEEGRVVAIVGPTGAGKTTLVNLLMRFYDVSGGQITIDGTDIVSVTRGSLRSAIAMVLQDTWLFSGTVRDNIAYGRPEATLEEIKEAAKKAHAHSFIRRLPSGYETVISGDGSGLSQGQQQLLTIARAMLLDPPILILDEATSSVDIRTEQKIQKAFAAMMTGRTCFVIAHRLSTIKHADIILVMKDGDIVEQGTHDALLKRGGLYRHLYESQFTRETDE